MVETDTVLETAAKLKAAGRPFALVTVVRCESPTSAKPGAKAVVEPDGVIQGWIGGGCAQPAVIKVAKKALQDGQARLIRISPSRDVVAEEGVTDFGMSCHSGGTLDIFIDPVLARSGVFIIGASPVAQVLCSLASRVGFSVTAAFPQADAELFPDADHIVADLELSDLPTPPFVVVATQGKRDEAGLEAAIATGADYVAFIASQRKADKLRLYLKERGHDDARVDAIIAPAGIELGAVTPEEIALSVLAGLVKHRRHSSAMSATALTGEEGAAPPQATGTDRTPVQETPSEAIDPVCGMSVDPASAEYRSEFSGKIFYFCCAHCQHSFDKVPEKFIKPTVEAT